jgi:hypothetical protein
MSDELTRIRRQSLGGIPPVEVVTPERYVEEYVIKTFDFTWGGDFDRALEVFRTLGMIPADLRAKPFLRRYGAALTAASYDFLERRILFPQTPLAEDVLLHELVHAMQDQRHDIRKLMLGTRFEFDRVLAMGALIEGDAKNVQLRYSMGKSRLLAGVIPYGTLRKEVRARSNAMREQLIAWLGDAPPNIVIVQSFAYDEGVLFVERLRRMKPGWQAVDAAYLRPPLSTSQILHPQKYIDGEWPVDLDIEGKAGFAGTRRLVAEDTLGEFGMRIFLRTQLPELEAPEKAVEGWRGDRIYLYRAEDEKTPVLVWLSTWNSPAKAEETKGLLAKSLARCIGKTPGMAARVERRDEDVVAVCAPAAAAESLLKARITRKTTEGRPLGEK